MTLVLVKPASSPAAERASSAAAEVAALIARAQAGEVVAFERLLAGHQQQVYAFAITFTGDPDLAKDLAQEALVKAYRAIGSFRFQASFSTWLYAIVRNAFRDHLRSRAAAERALDRPLLPSDLESASDPEGAADHQLIRHQERQALLAALHQVPEPYREVVFLSDVRGLNYDEIAAALAVAVGTVKSRLSRGREALRRILHAEVASGAKAEAKRKAED